jgi:HNH endonuclease
MTASISLTSSELARFNSFFNKHDENWPECWVYTGARNKGGGKSQKYWKGPGYGIFQTSTLVPKTRRAHRLAYELWNGPIPPGCQVQHTCDNPLCCNPDHLKLGTPKQNTEQMQRRGRIPTGSQHTNTKLNTETIQQIYDLCCEKLPQCKPHAKGNEAIYREIGEQFGISYSHVRNIHRGRRRAVNDPLGIASVDRGSSQRYFT